MVRSDLRGCLEAAMALEVIEAVGGNIHMDTKVINGAALLDIWVDEMMILTPFSPTCHHKSILKHLVQKSGFT